MIKFFRGSILTILLIWVGLVLLQVDSHVGVGSFFIVCCLAGIYYLLGKAAHKESKGTDDN